MFNLDHIIMRIGNSENELRFKVAGKGLLLVYMWADPGGTAIPGQPVERVEQAPNILPISKNQFNILDQQCWSYQILS
jgi:hypothetical protein